MGAKSFFYQLIAAITELQFSSVSSECRKENLFSLFNALLKSEREEMYMCVCVTP